jgi:thiosulfate dehydrogenase
MKPRTKILTALIAMSMLSSPALAQQLPTHQPAETNSGGVVVELCDGVTRTEVKGLKPGQAMTHAQALAVTHSLMAEWERKHPDQHWQVAQDASAGASTAETEASPAASTTAAETSSAPVPTATEAPKAPTPNQAAEKSQAPSNPVISGPGHRQSPPLQQGDTYASFNERDFKVWQANTDRFVQEGKEVFHSADKLGGTIGVSCDMCHPDAANTHPETYPKYQVQLQRVALLRDMIEWCIENPVKGKTMDPNDERLRALEAYIIAQRKGVPLDYGKH